MLAVATMAERCPTCSDAVDVVSGDEGTSHYQPVSPLSPSRLGRLRVGRKVGRTLYVQHGPGPSDEDALVGMVDTYNRDADEREAKV